MAEPQIYKSYFSTLNIAGQAMKTQRKRLDMVSLNLANINTVDAGNGKPYIRQIFVQRPFNETFIRASRNDKVVKLDNNNEAHLKASPYDEEVSRLDVQGVDGESLDDKSEPLRIYDPSHPLADKEGYVLKPNINVVSEMVELVSAQKEYEAVIQVTSAFKNFARGALNI